MKYSPYTDTKIIKIISLLLALCSLVLIGISLTADGFSADVIKAMALVPFSSAILLSIRFGICSYTYILEDFEFIIIRRFGKKTMTVCRLYYTDITKVIHFDEAKDKIKGRNRYSYRAKMLSKDFYCLFYTLENEDGVVLFEPNEAFVNLLKKHIQKDILND